MSAYIPPQLVEEIVDRIDIVELVGNYVLLKKKGRNFWGLCPFHSEKTPSFSVAPDKGIYYCFGCGKGGNALNFIMAVENISFPEAIERLAQIAGVTIPKYEMTERQKAEYDYKSAIYAIHNDAAIMYKNALNDPKIGLAARNYLSGRGLKPEICEKFSLGLSPESFDFLTSFLIKKQYGEKQLLDSGLVAKSEKTGRLYDKFRDRLLFPIFDTKGRVIAFGGRIMGNGEPKYLNSSQTPIFDKSHNFYALNFAANAIRSAGEAVIMEGYIDVITAHACGIENAIATLGTAFTAGHASLLKRYANSVTLAYDGDTAGIKAAERGIDILYKEGFDIRVVIFPDGMDPDDFLRRYGKVGWDNLLIERSQGLLEFRLFLALQETDISTVSGKGHLVQAMIPHIASCRNQVECDAFLRVLAKTVGVSMEAIFSDLRKYGYKREGGKSDKVLSDVKKTPQYNKQDELASELVFYMLSNREVYEKVKKELDFNFTFRQSLQELLTLVQNLKDSYSFKPSTLFSHIDDEEVRGALLSLLERNVDSNAVLGLATGCINAIKIERLTELRAKKSEELKTLLLKEDKEKVLKEIAALQQEIISLRK